MEPRNGLARQLEMRVRPRVGTDRLGAQLVAEGLITDEQLRQALDHQRQTGRRIGETLFELDMISSPDLTRVLAQRRGIVFVDLSDTAVDPELVRRLPVSMVQSMAVVPYAIEGDTLVLAMVNPEDGDALAAARTFVNGKVRAVMCDPEGLLAVMALAWPDWDAQIETGSAEDAAPIARDVQLCALAAQRLDEGEALWTPLDLVAWRNVLLLHAGRLAAFFSDALGVGGCASDFVSGWPGEDEMLGDALGRLEAHLAWIRRTLTQQRVPVTAHLADLARDLERVQSAFLAALPPERRAWFT
jgi:hypothetical protein